MQDIINPIILAAFIPTFFLVSFTPGLCMTLSITMGMSIGFNKTLWMMLGELTGVALIAISTVIGISTIMLKHPEIFYILKYGGGLYLTYIGISIFLSKGKMTFNIEQKNKKPSNKKLISQGFITAIANPKGWTLFIALLPPFIDNSRPLFSQLSILIIIILILEFTCLCIYCLSGKAMKNILQKSGKVKLINRISGALIILISIWLIIN